MKLVRDLTHKALVSIPASKTLQEAKDILFDNGITSVPVFDVQGTPLGLLTEIALVRCFVKFHSSKDKSKDTVFHHRELLEAVTVIRDDTPIPQAIRVFFSTPAHRLLVKDGQDKFVGMVSPRDILKVVSGDYDHLTGLQRDLNSAQEELRKVGGQLRDTEEILSRYHAYLESAPFFIHSVDEQGKLVFVNRTLREELGYNAREMIGLPLDRIYTPDQVEKSKQGLQKIMKEGGHKAVVTTMRRRDGKEVRVEAISSALTSPDGKFIATVTMSRPLASDNMLRVLHGIDEMGKIEPFE